MYVRIVSCKLVCVETVFAPKCFVRQFVTQKGFKLQYFELNLGRIELTEPYFNLNSLQCSLYAKQKFLPHFY